MDEFTKDFEEKGIENLDIMEDSGFLKKQGYSRNNGWRLIAVILGFLAIVSVFFIGYSIYDGKLQFNANPNILCEGSEFTCPELICECPSNNITCLPATVNVTINPNIIT